VQNTWHSSPKMDLSMTNNLADKIEAKIREIPASHGGYITVAPSNLGRVLDGALLRKIAEVAATVANGELGGDHGPP